MYRVGDFVFFESLPSAPYQIRKIEELNRCANGTVEAKVLCFYRRRDLPPSVVEKADSHLQGLFDSLNEAQNLSLKDKTKIADRELFMTRQVDTVSATCIRGKCVVNQYLDNSSLSSYIAQEDLFFYSLVYDHSSKMLNPEKGNIRVGQSFQADIPELITKKTDSEEEIDISSDITREELYWSANASTLSVEQLDEYLILSRALATLSRSVHLPTCLKQPDLVQTVSAASRDVTTENALYVLNQCHYSVSTALSKMVHWNEDIEKHDQNQNRQCTLALWRDEMELWSVQEGNLYEEGLEAYGKSFKAIQEKLLPWKNLKDIISYYYFWKTTEPYVVYRRRKSTATENRLRQVYIPNYSHQPNASILYPPSALKDTPIGCESCHSQQSPLWYAWGRPGAQFKLCENCWSYWKRYGALKARLALVTDKGNIPCFSDDKETTFENGRSGVSVGPLTESTLMTRCMTMDWCDAIIPAHFPALVHHMTNVHLFAEEYSHMLAASCLQHAKPLGILLAKMASSRTLEGGGHSRSLLSSVSSSSNNAEKVPTLLRSTPILRLARSKIIPSIISSGINSSEKNASKTHFFRKIARKAGLMSVNKMPWENRAVLIKACLDTLYAISYEDAQKAIQPRCYVNSKNDGSGLRHLYDNCRSWSLNSFDSNETLDSLLLKLAEKLSDMN